MSEVCRKEYDRPNSDLLDEHDKWFCNLNSDQKPENYPEWYNSWMDTKHGLYVLYVAGMLMQPNLISPTLMLNPLPASLEASMGAVQGPDMTATQRVSMSNSMGVSQSKCLSLSVSV
jgi:hypothetical protein